MITTSIFMGANIPDAGTVSDTMFSNFVNNEIASRLDGFTLTEAKGYWKGQPERTFVLTVLHDDADNGASMACEEIAESYKTQFRQDSVLVTSLPTVATFV
jgi:hypothetical protein